MVFQRQRRTKHRHNPVTGELIHRAAVTHHDRCRDIDQLGHDLAQPLRPYRSGDIHRVDHVGEQHGDLFVFGRWRPGRNGCTALAAELGFLIQRRAARSARQPHGGHLTRSDPLSLTPNIVSPLTRRVCYIHPAIRPETTTLSRFNSPFDHAERIRDASAIVPVRGDATVRIYAAQTVFSRFHPLSPPALKTLVARSVRASTDRSWMMVTCQRSNVRALRVTRSWPAFRSASPAGRRSGSASG